MFQAYPRPATFRQAACSPSRAAAGTATAASGTAAPSTSRSQRDGAESARRLFRLDLLQIRVQFLNDFVMATG